MDKYDDLANLSGGTKEYYIKRLEKLFNNPCQETWQNAYSLIIGSDNWTTLSQCVVAVDPTFQDNKDLDADSWKRIPDFFTLRRALKYAQNCGTWREERQSDPRQFHPGDQIIYIPDHANGPDHKDAEFGFVTSITDQYVFCRYWSKHEPDKLRTVANSESTMPYNLIKSESHPQGRIDALLGKIVTKG
jgi:hypothetical protein